MAKYPNVLRRALDAIFYVLIVVTGISLALLVYFLGWQPDDVSMTVPISFTPDADTVSITSDIYGEGTIVSANGIARFEDVGGSGHMAQALVMIASFIVPAFVILHLLRRLMRTVAEGAPFQIANVKRIRAIGWMVVGFEILFGIAAFLLELSISDQVIARGITLNADFSVNASVVMLGLVIVALAEVFRYGADLQVDSDLTV